MSCQEHRQSDLCGDSPLQCFEEVNTNFASIVSIPLDLDQMCMSYQLPRYLVSGMFGESAEELPFSMELGSASLFETTESTVAPGFPQREFHIEYIFQTNPSLEKVVSDTKLAQPKKKKSQPRRSTKSSIKLEEAGNMVNFKLNYQPLTDKEVSEPEFKNRLSCSEPPTEDSTSTFETFGFPGLAGSHAYFRKASCVACKQSKIVFWFGDFNVKKQGEKFSCADCIRSSIGEENFLSLLQIECQWTCDSSCDLGEKRPWQSLKQYVRQRLPQNIDSTEIGINYLIDEKKFSVKKTLSKQNNILIAQKAKGDLETSLLCLRFVHDLIESLNRLVNIHSKVSLKDKLDCMDQTEREYYQKELEKIEPAVVALKAEAIKALEVEASRVEDEQVSCTNPARSLGFGLDFDESPALGKRDSVFKDQDSFSDIEEPGLDLSYKIMPFMLPHF